jgi:hypothetical protein
MTVTARGLNPDSHYIVTNSSVGKISLGQQPLLPKRIGSGNIRNLLTRPVAWPKSNQTGSNKMTKTNHSDGKRTKVGLHKSRKKPRRSPASKRRERYASYFELLADIRKLIHR